MYSSKDEMTLGDLPWPSFVDKDAHMVAITDEIDSYIGFMYATPVNVTDTGPVARPARLLLKRISIALSTGRAILTMAAPGEGERLHAYGNRLVNEALAALRAISKGEIVLEGAEKNPDQEDNQSGPLLYNEDPRSQVETFYDFFKPTTIGSYPRTN